MAKVKEESKIIYGLKVHTSNEKEMNSKTAKIGTLWGEYFEKILPSLVQGTQVYGVYSNYESNALGEFDVLAGSEVANNTLEKVTLKKGNYLSFKVRGGLPQAVIDTWGKIWYYFSNENCPHSRVFKTDYELYLSESEANIYIGVA